MAQVTAPIHFPSVRYVVTRSASIGPPALIGTLLFGAIIRLVGIGHQSIWLDEAFSVFLSKRSPDDIVSFVAANDSHPPLYYLVLHYWMVLGDSEMTLRLFSALVGVGSIYLMYKLGETLYDRETGLLAAVFVSTSPFLVWYSQETRMYALLLFTTLASAYCLAHAMRAEDRRWWAGYVLATAAALYTNNGALWYFLATAIYLALARKRLPDFQAVVAAQVAVVLCYLPWLPSFIAQTRRVTQNFWLKPPTFDTVLDTFTAFQSFNFPVEVLSIIWVTVVMLWVHLLPRQRSEHRDLLTTWLFIPIVVSFLLSLRQPIFLLRNLTTAAIGYYLLLARGLWSFKSPRIAMLAVVPLLLMNAVSFYHNYAVEKKEQWRDAAAYVNSHAAENQLMLFVPGYSEMPFKYYEKSALPKRGYPFDEALVHAEPVTTEDLAATSRDYREVWLVLSHPEVVDPEGKAKAWFDANAGLISTKRFKDIDVLRYQLQGVPTAR